jgi:N-acyl homoserine lactone hydrolase
MVDTGENANINNSGYFKSSGMFDNWFNNKMFKFSIDREQEIDKQLLKIGIHPNDVITIVLTHLHLDHTDGLGHFPKSKVIVNKQEWKNPFGDLPKLYLIWLKPELIELNEKYQHFDRAFYLTDSKELIAIHTPGHTHGRISVVLKTGDYDFAFAGDIFYLQDQLINNSYSGINISYSFAKDTYNKFRVLSKTYIPGSLPSYDKEAGARLEKLIPLYVD